MAELRNEFAWSKSRSRKLVDCKRLFWFDTYGMWGGWKATAPDRTKQIYRLHKLKNRKMWAGEVVHVSIARILHAYRDGEVLDPEEVVRDLKPRMRKDFGDSRDGRSHEPGGSKLCSLKEHAFNEQISKEEWAKVAAHSEKCLRNFIGSDLFQKLKRVRTSDWLAIEEDEFAFFQVAGVKVWVKVDAAYRSERGVHIIDWKTGNAEDELGPLQLAVYSLYARSAWLGLGKGDVFAGLCDLAGDEAVHVEEVVTEDQLETARRQILAEADTMAALLSSSREENVGLEDKYPGTDVPKVCRGCSFHRICPVTPLLTS